MKKGKKEETMKDFSVKRGKCEASVKCESRSRVGMKKKTHEKTPAAPMYIKIEKPRKTFWE